MLTYRVMLIFYDVVNVRILSKLTLICESFTGQQLNTDKPNLNYCGAFILKSNALDFADKCNGLSFVKEVIVSYPPMNRPGVLSYTYPGWKA